MAEQSGVVNGGEANYWTSQRIAYLSGLNDRMRTLALGALAVIWGLYMGEGQKALKFSKGLRIALLAVAMSIIMVLLLDFLEYAMGYFMALQLEPGYKMNPSPFPFRRWKNNSMILKHILGSSTLLTLVVLLGIVLFSIAAHGQTAEEMKPYLGEWCGGDYNGNNHMTLKISFEQTKASAEWKWTSDKAFDICEATFSGDHLQLNCPRILIKVQPDGHHDYVQAAWGTGHANGVNTLLNCKH